MLETDLLTDAFEAYPSRPIIFGRGRCPLSQINHCAVAAMNLFRKASFGQSH
jgi:hypothetical protein